MLLKSRYLIDSRDLRVSARNPIILRQGSQAELSQAARLGSLRLEQHLTEAGFSIFHSVTDGAAAGQGLDPETVAAALMLSEDCPEG